MIYTKSKNTYFTTPKDDVKDLISLEVGDSKVPEKFLPQQKIMRWNNEVNVSLRLVHDEVSPTVSKSGEKITWEGKKVKAEIYPITEDEGGQEFEITLKEQPKSNVIQFTLVDKGVQYFYQPFLKNQNEDGSFWEEDEQEGRIECPANVGGSYAIYASENKINYTGGKEYKIGKVGHIYRPKIEDANGDWVWGELNIKNGILSVTIPQDFLDKAVYPVKHAAGLTFGYTSIGANNVGYGNFWHGGVFTATAGDIESITTAVGFSGLTSTQNLKFKNAIYLTNNTLVGTTVEENQSITTADNNTTSWRTAAFSSNVTVTATSYALISWSKNFSSSGGMSMKADSGSLTNGRWYNFPSYTGSFPNPYTNYKTSSDTNVSIYATYTAGGGATNNTETPTSQTSTFSLPTPTITAVKNVTVSLSVQSSTFSLPTPSVSTATDVTVSNLLVSATLSLPVVSVSTTSNVSITLNNVALLATNPDPTVLAQKNVSTSVDILTNTFTLNPLTVITTTNVTVSPNVQTLNSSQPILAVSTQVYISVLANAIEVSSSQPTISVSTTSNVSISLPTQTVLFSTQDITVSAIKNVSTSVNVLTNTFNLGDITLSTGVNVNPNVQTVGSTAISPEITTTKNVNVSADIVSATFSQNSPSISSSGQIDVGVNNQEMLFSIPEIAVTAIKNVNVTLGENLTFTQKDITVRGDSNVSVNSISLQSSVSPLSVQAIKNIALTMEAVYVGSSAISPTVTAEGNVSVDTLSLLFSQPIPTIESNVVGAIYNKNANFYIEVEDDPLMTMILGQPKFPTWNTLGRPTGTRGIYGYNFETDKLEFYNGTNWNEISLTPIV